MRYRLFVKEDNTTKFKPVRDFPTLKAAALHAEGQDHPFKVWDFKAEGWVDPHEVLLACIFCNTPGR